MLYCPHGAFAIDTVDIVRYAASVGLAIAGAVSLVVEFRNPSDRRLTRRGMWMLGTIVILGVTLVVIQILSDGADHQRHEEETLARDADRRKLQVLEQQLARAALPLTPIEIGYWFRITEASSTMEVAPRRKSAISYHAELPRYLKRVRTRLEPNFRRPGMISRFSALGISAGSDDSFVVCEGSPLFPNKILEPKLYLAVHAASLTMQIFRHPISVEDHPWFRDNSLSAVKPDVEVSVYGSVPSRSRECPLCGCVWLDQQLADLSVATRYEIQASSLTTNGKLTSAIDLPGAQILVRPLPVTSHYDRLQVTVRRFSLKPGAFVELFLPLRKRAVHTRHVSTGFLYDVTLPPRTEDLRELRNHRDDLE